MSALAAAKPPRAAGRADLLPIFRRHASAVAVITSGAREKPHAFTVTSLVDVPNDPPLLAFSVRRPSLARDRWTAGPVGTVHLLHAAQSALADTCADPAVDSFDGTHPWRWHEAGGPVFADALAWLTVEGCGARPVGDHDLILAEIRDVLLRPGAVPLLRFDHRYVGLEPGANR